MRRLILAFALLLGLPALAGCLPLITDSVGAGSMSSQAAHQYVPQHATVPAPTVRDPKDTLGGGPTT
jgi:hypothetical protein